MCRMLAVRTQRPAPAGALLLEGKRSLLALSHEHAHGWGIGRYVGGKPLVDKGTGAAHADPMFERAARESVSGCTLAHVRRISVGELRLENTHPFRRGKLLFAHNGTIWRFAENRAALLSLVAPELRAEIHGDTDSEHAFALFLSLLGERKGLEALASALAATARRVFELPTEPDKAHILNLLVTDGESLVGLAAGKELAYLASPKVTAGPVERLVIASEPATEPETAWQQLSWGELVGIDASMIVRRWTLDELAPAPVTPGA